MWLLNLAPSADLIAWIRKHDTPAGWGQFHHLDFSVGCYCDDERLCHRGGRRRVLTRQGATVVG